MVNEWTRDDFPASLPDAEGVYGPSVLVPSVRRDLAAWLNAHHPKPECRCNELRSLVEGQKEHVTKAQRERDRWKAATKRALEHRDEWKARADQLRDERDDAVQSCIAVGRERDEAQMERTDALCERDAAIVRAEAAEARTAPAVTCEQRNAVADHLWNAMVGSAKSVVRDVVAQAFVAAGIEVAVEAEQAVDPVEARADELADILYGDGLVTDQMRGVLELVVRAGMLFPEQEASSDE